MLKTLVSLFILWRIGHFFIKNYAFASKSSTPIGVLTNDWTSQIVLAKMTGSILQKVGYKTNPAAKEWLKTHQALWNLWIPQTCEQ